MQAPDRCSLRPAAACELADCPHFTDEAAEAHKGPSFCPGPHSVSRSQTQRGSLGRDQPRGGAGPSEGQGSGMALQPLAGLSAGGSCRGLGGAGRSGCLQLRSSLPPSAHTAPFPARQPRGLCILGSTEQAQGQPDGTSPGSSVPMVAIRRPPSLGLLPRRWEDRPPGCRRGGHSHRPEFKDAPAWGVDAAHRRASLRSRARALPQPQHPRPGQACGPFVPSVESQVLGRGGGVPAVRPRSAPGQWGCSGTQGSTGQGLPGSTGPGGSEGEG